VPTYRLENEMLLAVTLAGEAVHARRGAMIATTGDVSFSRVGDLDDGVARAALRATREHGPWQERVRWSSVKNHTASFLL
jgi:uncharacterized protein (AIM24 family)